MSHRLFFVPVSNISKSSKFYETAINGIKIGNHKKYIWGILSPDKRWNRLQQGDLLAVYNKGEIVYITSIADKFINKELSENLWGFKKKIDGSIHFYEKILVFDKIHSCNINYDTIKKLANYKPKSSVRYFFEIAQEGYDSIIEEHGSLVEFIKKTAPNTVYK
jgi:hypothetical protein